MFVNIFKMKKNVKRLAIASCIISCFAFCSFNLNSRVKCVNANIVDKKLNEISYINLNFRAKNPYLRAIYTQAILSRLKENKISIEGNAFSFHKTALYSLLSNLKNYKDKIFISRDAVSEKNLKKFIENKNNFIFKKKELEEAKSNILETIDSDIKKAKESIKKENIKVMNFFNDTSENQLDVNKNKAFYKNKIKPILAVFFKDIAQKVEDNSSVLNNLNKYSNAAVLKDYEKLIKDAEKIKENLSSFENFKDTDCVIKSLNKNLKHFSYNKPFDEKDFEVKDERFNSLNICGMFIDLDFFSGFAGIVKGLIDKGALDESKQKTLKKSIKTFMKKVETSPKVKETFLKKLLNTVKINFDSFNIEEFDKEKENVLKNFNYVLAVLPEDDA